MKIISSEPKQYLLRLGKGLINSLGVKTIRRSNKNKKARYAIPNVSLKDISEIVKESDKFLYDAVQPKTSPISTCRII